MPYRYLKAEVGVSVDSSLTRPIFGPYAMTAYQTLDLKADPIYTTVAPSAN
jgi:hypothetical protein